VASIAYDFVDVIKPFAPCKCRVNVPDTCTEAALTAGQLVPGPTPYSTIVSSCGALRAESTGRAPRSTVPLIDYLCRRNATHGHVEFAYYGEEPDYLPAGSIYNYVSRGPFNDQQPSHFASGYNLAFGVDFKCDRPPSWDLRQGCDRPLSVKAACVAHAC
jgi:hypothetical protein